jgi:hypothetical protein
MNRLSQNAWVIGFCLITIAAYFHFISEKRTSLSHLATRLGQMEREKIVALQKKEEYQLRLASQNDPAWIELILMRDLGVVPEGFLKVHFKK